MNKPFRFANAVFNPAYLVSATTETRTPHKGSVQYFVNIETTRGSVVSIKLIDELEQEATLQEFLLLWEAAVTTV